MHHSQIGCWQSHLQEVSYFFFQSTNPSHSVGANVQHVLHLMKQHTKALCNSRVVNDTLLAKPIRTGHPAGKSRKSSLPKESSSSQEELSEVLLTLQDEFGQMSLWVWHIRQCRCFMFLPSALKLESPCLFPRQKSFRKSPVCNLFALVAARALIPPCT